MMRTYEYPLGTQFRASTGEHAASRVFGGKPADYIATEHAAGKNPRHEWLEVTSADGTEFIGDIPIVN